MHDRVTICGGVLGGHPRLVADEILALSVANCRSTWRWRDGSSARMGPHEKARRKKPKGAVGKVVRDITNHGDIIHFTPIVSTSPTDAQTHSHIEVTAVQQHF